MNEGESVGARKRGKIIIVLSIALEREREGELNDQRKKRINLYVKPKKANEKKNVCISRHRCIDIRCCCQSNERWDRWNNHRRRRHYSLPSRFNCLANADARAKSAEFFDSDHRNWIIDQQRKTLLDLRRWEKKEKNKESACRRTIRKLDSISQSDRNILFFFFFFFSCPSSFSRLN